jgi:hypothetical protein
VIWPKPLEKPPCVAVLNVPLTVLPGLENCVWLKTLSLDENLPVPEDRSILVEKAVAVPAEPPVQRRSQHQAQQ